MSAADDRRANYLRIREELRKQREAERNKPVPPPTGIKERLKEIAERGRRNEGYEDGETNED